MVLSKIGMHLGNCWLSNKKSDPLALGWKRAFVDGSMNGWFYVQYGNIENWPTSYLQPVYVLLSFIPKLACKFCFLVFFVSFLFVVCGHSLRQPDQWSNMRKICTFKQTNEKLNLHWDKRHWKQETGISKQFDRPAVRYCSVHSRCKAAFRYHQEPNILGNSFMNTQVRKKQQTTLIYNQLPCVYRRYTNPCRGIIVKFSFSCFFVHLYDWNAK